MHNNSRKIMKSIKNSKHEIGDGHLPMIIMTKYLNATLTNH